MLDTLDPRYAKNDSLDAERVHTEPRNREKLAGDMVPRDGVEPPTRGFSKQQAIANSVEESATFSQALSGSCTASDPDTTLKDAIKAAVDAGLYDRARALVDVLSKTSPPAEVVDIRERRR